MLEKLKQKNILYILTPLFLLLISFVFVTKVEAISFTQQIPIPGVATSTIQPDRSTKALGEYIKGVYNYGIGIVAILATAVMMFGGFQWIIAGGSAEKIGEAKAWIAAALTGLVLAISSYSILNLVNPNLTALQVQDIREVNPIPPKALACCTPEGNAATVAVVCSVAEPDNCREECTSGAIDCDEYCENKNPGSSCYGGGGHCYTSQCYMGDGAQGEPCGIGTDTYCADVCLMYNVYLMNPISGIIGGRDCGEDLWCCR